MNSFFSKKAQLLYVASLLALGFFLRLYHLAWLPLWRDETFSANAASLSIKEALAIASADTQPPFHIGMLHYWIKLFGSSEFSIRLPSVIFGVITLFFVYKLALLYFLNKRHANLALLIACFSPVLLFYSQEARAYSILTASTTAFIYFGLKTSSNGRALQDWIGLIISALVGLYSHNIFFVIISAFTLFEAKTLFSQYKLKLYKSKIFWKYLIAYFIALILYIPWLFEFLRQVAKVQNEDFWLDFHPISSVLYTWVTLFLGPELKYARNTFEIVLLIANPLLGTVLLIFGIRWGLLRRKERFPFPLFLGSVMLLFVYIVSFWVPFFYIRYLVFVVPFAMIIIADGIIGLKEKFGKRLAIALTLLFLVFNFLFYLGVVMQDEHLREDSVSALNYIKSKYDSETDIVIHPHVATYHDAKHYSDIPTYIYDPERDSRYYEGLAGVDPEDYYDGDLTEFRRLWVFTQWDDYDFEAELSRMRFKWTHRENFNGGLDIDLWEIAN